MKEITSQDVTQAVETLCISSNCTLSEDAWEAIKEMLKDEESPTGKEVLEQILENDRLAKEEKLPMCQDTGFTTIFVEMGQEVGVNGGDFYEAINQGVRNGYKKGYLRKSVVKDPLRRKNTGDNTPPWVHIDIIPGDRLKISVMPKGAGSENMSTIKMLTPAEGVQGVKRFVLDWVRERGANACPPLVVGVGIGGTFEGVAKLAKKALLRPIGSKNPEPFYAEIEEDFLKEINNLGLGPQGLGGSTTALAVHIEPYPCHIASLPLAINLQCHAVRHATIVL
ncbi:fumarate hydratase [bacterium]|nr:fumarate hydratase [bacterium]NIN93282.1 fumarate hydratase [bacterium]NIO19077.1 fumarate hydratase [bacterium]NIO74208.1 fumarate hydratase [bacterium]